MNSFLILNINLWEYKFLAPQWLWLLLLVPLFLYFRYAQQSKSKGMVKSSRLNSDLKNIEFGWMKWLIIGVYTLLGFGISLFVLAMAKPVLHNDDGIVDYSEGIEIIISMDVSGSMMATDFLPNRIEAAKEMAKEFVNNRKADKIGFVAFEGEAYTVCPTTRNHDYLKMKISEIQSGKLIPGTAIGTGLGTAVARLRNDSTTTKVIILLTDGENNSGDLSPLEAAYIAKQKNIRVYTIGVGQKGFVKTPIETPFGRIMQETEVSIDEDLLTEMAELTGGLYFRATDENSLHTIYETIDKLEKNEMPDDLIQREPPYKPVPFILYGILFLLAGFLLEQLILRENG